MFAHRIVDEISHLRPRRPSQRVSPLDIYEGRHIPHPGLDVLVAVVAVEARGEWPSKGQGHVVDGGPSAAQVNLFKCVDAILFWGNCFMNVSGRSILSTQCQTF